MKNCPAILFRICVCLACLTVISGNAGAQIPDKHHQPLASTANESFEPVDPEELYSDIEKKEADYIRSRMKKAERLKSLDDLLKRQKWELARLEHEYEHRDRLDWREKLEIERKIANMKRAYAETLAERARVEAGQTYVRTMTKDEELPIQDFGGHNIIVLPDKQTKPRHEQMDIWDEGEDTPPEKTDGMDVQDFITPAGVAQAQMQDNRYQPLELTPPVIDIPDGIPGGECDADTLSKIATARADVSEGMRSAEDGIAVERERLAALQTRINELLPNISAAENGLRFVLEELAEATSYQEINRLEQRKETHQNRLRKWREELQANRKVQLAARETIASLEQTRQGVLIPMARHTENMAALCSNAPPGTSVFATEDRAEDAVDAPCVGPECLTISEGSPEVAEKPACEPRELMYERRALEAYRRRLEEEQGKEAELEGQAAERRQAIADADRQIDVTAGQNRRLSEALRAALNETGYRITGETSANLAGGRTVTTSINYTLRGSADMSAAEGLAVGAGAMADNLAYSLGLLTEEDLERADIRRGQVRERLGRLARAVRETGSEAARLNMDRFIAEQDLTEIEQQLQQKPWIVAIDELSGNIARTAARIAALEATCN